MITLTVSPRGFARMQLALAAVACTLRDNYGPAACLLKEYAIAVIDGTQPLEPPAAQTVLEAAYREVDCAAIPQADDVTARDALARAEDAVIALAFSTSDN